MLVEIMKPDFSELKSSAPLYGGSNELLLDGFSAAPAFDLPFDEYQKKSVQMVKPAKGTTTVAFVFKDGVMCRLDELANKRKISVTGASKLLANILYSYRGKGLFVGKMIAGWDEKVESHP
ncbi:proteasome subunit beta type-5 [Tanacetum coccineum]